MGFEVGEMESCVGGGVVEVLVEGDERADCGKRDRQEDKRGDDARREPARQARGRRDRGDEEAERVFGVAISVQRRRAIVKALAEKAANGDVQATIFLFDRMYGRPGVAPKPTVIDGSETTRLNLRRLDEEETQIFARLFEKCVVEDGEVERGPRGEMGGGGVALSEGPGGVCEGGATGEVVGEADGGGGGPADP